MVHNRPHYKTNGRLHAKNSIDFTWDNVEHYCLLYIQLNVPVNSLYSILGRYKASWDEPEQYGPYGIAMFQFCSALTPKMHRFKNRMAARFLRVLDKTNRPHAYFALFV